MRAWVSPTARPCAEGGAGGSGAMDVMREFRPPMFDAMGDPLPSCSSLVNAQTALSSQTTPTEKVNQGKCELSRRNADGYTGPRQAAQPTPFDRPRASKIKYDLVICLRCTILG